MAKPRRNATQWQALINKWQQSGLTIAEFCKTQGLHQSGFYAWKKKLLSNIEIETDKMPEQLPWLQLPQTNSVQAKTGWDMELSLPGGVVLRMRQAG